MTVADTTLTVSPLSRIWVQPRDGRAFYLRMVSQHGRAGAMGVADFLPELGSRVESAGGSMSTKDKRPHPNGTHPTFSTCSSTPALQRLIFSA